MASHQVTRDYVSPNESWALYAFQQMGVELICLSIFLVDLAMVFYYADRAHMRISTIGWNFLCALYIILRLADLSTRSLTVVKIACLEGYTAYHRVYVLQLWS